MARRTDRPNDQNRCQCTDFIQVLVAIRMLTRLMAAGETPRPALNCLATVVPNWLRALVPAERYERYRERIEHYRLPKEKPERGPSRDKRCRWWTPAERALCLHGAGLAAGGPHRGDATPRVAATIRCPRYQGNSTPAGGKGSGTDRSADPRIHMRATSGRVYSTPLPNREFVSGVAACPGSATARAPAQAGGRTIGQSQGRFDPPR